MPKLKFILILSLLLAGLYCPARSFEFRYWPEQCCPVPNALNLRKDVEYLCDSLSAGRASGSEGAEKCRAFIAGRFAKAGLQPWNGEWMHYFQDSLCNVIGYVPGASGKWIAVGAYYDSLGEISSVLYPGADANASGIAALLALASLVKEPQGDGIIFVAFDGHHRDYAGARAFLELFPHPRREITLMLSLDTVGSTLAPVRNQRTNYLIALGGERYEAQWSRAARFAGLELYYDYYGSERFTRLFLNKIGEQSVFLDSRIPAMLLTSGVTMNTNKVTDTPDTLDYEVLRLRILCAVRFLTELNSRPNYPPTQGLESLK